MDGSGHSHATNRKSSDGSWQFGQLGSVAKEFGRRSQSEPVMAETGTAYHGGALFTLSGAIEEGASFSGLSTGLHVRACF